MQEMQEIQVWFLDWKDSLEEEMATHSRILDNTGCLFIIIIGIIYY